VESKSKFLSASGFIRLFLLTWLVFSSFYASSSFAHGKRENYVWVNIEQDHIDGRFELNVKDIRSKLGIQLPESEAERDKVLDETAGLVQTYLLDNFSLSFDGEERKIQFSGVSPPDEENSRWVKYHFRVEGVPENDLFEIQNSIFLSDELLKLDPLHKSLVLLDYNKFRGLDFGSENTAVIFGPHVKEASFSTIKTPEILVADDFLYQGLIHIWFGLDHMLFLFTLLLTTVLLYKNKQWEPIPKVSGALINLLKIITIFTVSHSITLVLAVLGWVEVPTTLVEAIIAGSIIVVAFNNIFPLFSTHTWLLIFVFGLVHGLGFASAMGDLQFRNVKIEKVLILFSIGIELGQIAVVCVVLPLLYWIRKTVAYRKLIMPGLSLLCAVVAGFWFGQRVGWW